MNTTKKSKTRKLKLELPLLLPEIADEKDFCVKKIIALLEGKSGIESVHVSDDKETPDLCIHYHPEIITLKKVKNIAVRSGALLTKKYRHLQLDVAGIRHQRHARKMENKLLQIPGIVEAAASPTGALQLAWNSQQIGEEKVQAAVKNLGLRIRDKQSPADQTGETESDHKHHHGHTNFLGERTELYFAIGSGVFWLTGLVMEYLTNSPEWVSRMFFIIGILLGGYFTLLEAVDAIRKGKFEIDFLMLVAALGAGALGKWGEGALLLFLFSLGHSLEHFAMAKARKSIAALADLAPPTALVKTGDDLQEVNIRDLQIGDVIVVKPNTKIAADGVIVKGSSVVNQAPITGESIPVEKFPLPEKPKHLDLKKLPAAHRAFAGTINGNSVLEIQVLRLARESTLARLIELVKEAETQKSPTQQLADKFERYYVPVVLVVVVLLLFAFLVLDETFSQSFYRSMAVLIAASPCALAISTPSAVLAGVARAARKGVLIKGGRPLEDLGELSALAFDKTGTLTEGKPKLTNAVPFGEVSRTDLLSVAVAVEELSDHPLAAAIAAGGKKELGDFPIPQSNNLEALTARGVRATVANQTVHIGNRRLFEELTGEKIPEKLSLEMAKLEAEGHTAMIVHRGQQYLGIIAAMDVARAEAAETLAALKAIGIKKMVMLTGDNQQVAEAVAKSIGITDPMGNLLPEDKVAAIEKLKKEGKVAMIGDGVNDAPAMAKSTVGIAMGAAGSDVALETADIALMADRLSNLVFAIGLSRKAKQIIRQNLWISLGMVAVLVPLTLLGIAEIGPAVVAHEGSTLVVVLNALRLLGYNKG